MQTHKTALSWFSFVASIVLYFSLVPMQEPGFLDRLKGTTEISYSNQVYPAIGVGIACAALVWMLPYAVSLGFVGGAIAAAVLAFTQGWNLDLPTLAIGAVVGAVIVAFGRAILAGIRTTFASWRTALRENVAAGRAKKAKATTVPGDIPQASFTERRA